MMFVLDGDVAGKALVFEFLQDSGHVGHACSIEVRP